ncbi:iron ABC transporter permease [Actinospica sp. MGRD01-02]|uniref:Iron ABC transporter permease n=1 Tax=Actinospica acidithermotolerans TaxID=2828514 RepID=A0A941EGE0_9ACTN|nr:iron ABC transporter permease [Actinospica acidithermotolerans]MBR7830971.1 iron ABC transporter permease [Actinospica acidithermotolerans]
MSRTVRALTAAAVFAIAVAVLGALVGAADLSPWGVVATLLDRIPLVHLDTGLSPLEQNILLQIRLPRVVLALLVGGLLAVAGAGYQGVFRNALVDAGMLGSSAGAGLAATIAIVFLSGLGGSVVPVAAFVGSLLGVAVSWFASAGRRDTATLLLSGVAVGMFLTAAQTFLLQRESQDLQQVYSWMLGSMATASWTQVTEALPYAAVSILVLLVHSRRLDVLGLGDDEARSLGLNAGRTRLIVIAAASLAAATAVAVSGLIGFVGIVVPHVARRLGGPSYAVVLPLSLLVGAGFMESADTVARTALSPSELPIGVVTAIVGAPVFVGILRRSRVITE